MSNQALFAARAIPQGSSSRTRSALTHVLQTVFDERWVGQQHFTTTEELDALHAAACVGPGARVLELGSGLGGSAIYLARQQGCHVTGLDASPERVRLAQAAALDMGVADQVVFFADDHLMVDFPQGAFDAIVSDDAFITVVDKARLLARCRHWLREGGRLAAALIVDRGDLARAADPPTPLAWPIPSADDYCALVEAAGLRVLEIADLTESFREIGARWRGALRAWDLMLISELGCHDWQILRATVGRLAEWATQGRIGHIQLTAMSQPGSS